MSKMGRPKSDVIKDKIVTIRMSDEELQIPAHPTTHSAKN